MRDEPDDRIPWRDESPLPVTGADVVGPAHGSTAPSASSTDGHGALVAQVEELTRLVSELRRRLSALAGVLPPRYLPYLDADLDDLEAEAELELVDHSRDAADGQPPVIDLTESDVADELRRVWERLPSPDRS